MFVGRSSGLRLAWAIVLGALPVGLGACGLLIGLDDHQAFPSPPPPAKTSPIGRTRRPMRPKTPSRTRFRMWLPMDAPA